jgi:inosine-uridine nucleoside N-ribohydrolase
MPASEPLKKTPLILDTDIGHDMDDTWALAMLLGCPQLELKLLVTAFDNVETKTRLVAKMFRRTGNTHIPIGLGIKTSDLVMNQAAWLGDDDLHDYPGVIHRDGIAAMIELIHASPEPVTILAIGPMTNLQAALQRDPSIAQKARIVAMAGSLFIGYDGKPIPEPECNVVCDIPAACAVLQAGWPITCVPLDGCGDVVLRGERFARVANSSSAWARVIIENQQAWAWKDRCAPGESSILYDTVAVYAVFADAFCHTQTLSLSITDTGMTVPAPHGVPVRCFTGWHDREAFEEFLTQIIAP